MMEYSKCDQQLISLIIPHFSDGMTIVFNPADGELISGLFILSPFH